MVRFRLWATGGQGAHEGSDRGEEVSDCAVAVLAVAVN